MSQASAQQCLVSLGIAGTACLCHPVIYMNGPGELTVGNASRHQACVDLGIEVETVLLRVSINNLECHFKVIAPTIELHKDGQSEIGRRDSSRLHCMSLRTISVN